MAAETESTQQLAEEQKRVCQQEAAEQLAKEQEEVAEAELAAQQITKEQERAAHIPFLEYSVYGKVP